MINIICMPVLIIHIKDYVDRIGFGIILLTFDLIL